MYDTSTPTDPDIQNQIFNTLSQSEDSAPAYLKAADNHNLANVGGSWWDVNPANLPKFAAVSMISGFNSIYNTGVKLGNFLGADWDQNDTQAYISGLDNDLGEYYRQNKSAADLTGFLATSLIPGMAGIKVLNMGQKVLAGASEAGLIGENMSMALGLKTTQMESYVASAASQIRAGQTVFGNITTNSLKALATGAYQNVLEGAAFETAVQATMQASPILSDQSKSDVLFNIATGGLFGGALGGTIAGVKTLYEIRNGVKVLDAAHIPFGSRSTGSLIDQADPANRVIGYAFDAEHGPTLDPGDPNYATQVQELKLRQSRIANDQRSAIDELVPGKQSTLSRMMADHFVGTSGDDTLAAFIHTDEITNLQGATSVEREIKEGIKTGVDTSNLKVQYWKVAGEDTGTVSMTSPEVSNLADRVTESAGKSIRDAVLDDVRSRGFSISKQWDATQESLAQGGHLNAEARYIWARNILSKVPEDVKVHENDFPILERALQDGQTKINVVDSAGKSVRSGFSSAKELQDFIVSQKKAAIDTLGEKAASLDSAGSQSDWLSQKISKITNTPVATAEGTGQTGHDAIDYFAHIKNQLDRDNYLQQRGIKPVKGEENDPDFMPTWAKVTKRIPDGYADQASQVDGLTYTKMQQQITQDAMRNVSVKQMGSLGLDMPEIQDRHLLGTNSYGTGGGFFTINNPGYDTAGSIVSRIGGKTQQLDKQLKDEFQRVATSDVVALGRNQEAAIEWDTLHQKVSRTTNQYAPWSDANDLDEEGNSLYRGLFSKQALKAAGAEFDSAGRISDLSNVDRSALEEFLQDPKNANHGILVDHDETWNMVNTHIDRSDVVWNNRNERAAAQGYTTSRELGLFRPIPANPRDYPFFAFVKDPQVTDQGHTSMIFAKNESELNQLIDKAQSARPELNIITKKDAEDFYRARQSYDYNRTLSDNYIDSDLKSSGVYSNYFTKTDPAAITKQFLDYHSSLLTAESKDIVRNYYNAQFNWLEDQAKNYSRTALSRFGSDYQALEDAGANPYLSYIKTALNLSRSSEAPLWTGVNKWMDDTFTRAYDGIKSAWSSGSGTQASLDAVNQALQKYGMNNGYYDAATNLLANSQVSRGVLSSFVRNANAILSRLVVTLDPLNTVVHSLGVGILRATELSQLTDAVKEGNTEIAGKLAQLSHVDVTGQGDMIMSPAKLMSKAVSDFWNEISAEGASKLNGKPVGPLADKYRAMGILRDPEMQALDWHNQIVKELTVTGNESGGALSDKVSNAMGMINKLVDVGEMGSGTRLKEAFNRFVSARSMDLLTQPGVDAGLFSEAEQKAYINTFVNRVEGNVLASQRPLAFQGPIGQAIGLFQSFHFNMMQQLFRYVGEGSAKDAAMLLGLQGTFFGAQGLPAFQAINQHIIGNASGNIQHRDAYDAAYGILGKKAGDLLLYGLPSNLLQTNIYDRGDLNPRTLTVLPTSPQDIPFISAFMKFGGAMKDMLTKMTNDGNVWESFLQGIEHNGISRPLAGLAQTLQATTGNGTPMSTSSKGNIMFSNDLMSMATMARIAGGRPLDEAIVNDGLFRNQAYAQAMRDKMDSIGEAVKSSSINGQEMSADQVSRFAQEFAAAGGKQVQFNQWMMKEIKDSNTSRAEMIVHQLQNPLNQKIQTLMGTQNVTGSLANLSAPSSSQ